MIEVGHFKKINGFPTRKYAVGKFVQEQWDRSYCLFQLETLCPEVPVPWSGKVNIQDFLQVFQFKVAE